MPLSPNKIKYCTLPIQSYPSPGQKPPLKNLLPQLMPSLFSLLHPSNYPYNFNTCWKQGKEREKEKPDDFLPALSSCLLYGSGLYLHTRQETGGSLPLEREFSEGGDKQFYFSCRKRHEELPSAHICTESSHLTWEKSTGRLLSTSPDVGVTKHNPATATSSTVHYTVCVFA